MKTIIFILLLAVSSTSFAYNDGFKEFPSPNDYWRNKEIQAQENMRRGLEREVWETGRISPKTPLDVENLRNGYGYDGGISTPGINYPSGGSYDYEYGY